MEHPRISMYNITKDMEKFISINNELLVNVLSLTSNTSLYVCYNFLNKISNSEWHFVIVNLIKNMQKNDYSYFYFFFTEGTKKEIYIQMNNIKKCNITKGIIKSNDCSEHSHY